MSTQQWVLRGSSPVQLLTTPRTVAPKAPLSMGLSRQEFWSGSPCPPPGESSQAGDQIQVSHIASKFFTIYGWEPSNPFHCPSLKTDAEAEAPVLWPPDGKSQLIGEDPDAGKDGRQKEKGTAEGEMAGWHHRLNGHGCG